MWSLVDRAANVPVVRASVSNREGISATKPTILAIVLLISVAAAADSSQTREGGVLQFDYGKCVAVVRVVDSAGKPVPDAVVGVRIPRDSPHGDTRVRSNADSDGVVRFLGLPEGSFTFSAAEQNRKATRVIDTAKQCEGKYEIALPQ
jgi:hypothetical protein